jgi:hypothetical protein
MIACQVVFLSHLLESLQADAAIACRIIGITSNKGNLPMTVSHKLQECLAYCADVVNRDCWAGLTGSSKTTGYPAAINSWM